MKALCVGIINRKENFLDAQESLLELKELGKSMGYTIIDSLLLSCSKIDAASYLSKPMVQELKIDLEEKEGEILLFNEELSPTQLKNLENILEIVVLDRTELILKIFQEHAQTQEAKLQVEIAQLKYSLPRLKRMWTHLSRIEGGFGFTKGPGETQIELDRRTIKNRISRLSKKLDAISIRRETRRKKRLTSGLLKVSLTGYTNAGKTSLLNLLAKENLLVEDKLFATLSPVTRKVFLSSQKYALVSDTVGFIKKLPTSLIASFKSTLQEIKLSDIILLVQDASNKQLEKQKNEVFSILGQLEALHIPVILVFTKIDLLSLNDITSLKNNYPQGIFISSVTEEGVESLKEKLLSFIKEEKYE